MYAIRSYYASSRALTVTSVAFRTRSFTTASNLPVREIVALLACESVDGDTRGRELESRNLLSYNFV